MKYLFGQNKIHYDEGEREGDLLAKAEARQKCLKFNINWDYFIWDYRIFPFHKSLYTA